MRESLGSFMCFLRLYRSCMEDIDLSVFGIDGKKICTLNKSLIEWKLQGSKEEKLRQIKKIKGLHAFKAGLFKLIEESEEENLPLLQEYVEATEYALQRAWGFEEDKNYHKFWLTPRCLCPSVDNMERYASGYYIYNLDCPLHGKSIEKD